MTAALAALCAAVCLSLALAAGGGAEQIDYKSSIRQLLGNLEYSLNLFHSGGVNAEVLKWDLIANNEVHIMLKLVRYLRVLLKQPDEALSKLVEGGYQCDATTHPFQQESISRQVEMSICSEIEWYKTAQLTFPEAKTIIDVGGNKGYLGSLFVALWGGGGYRVTPHSLSSIFVADKVWVRNPYGFCRDGLNYGLPMHCSAQYTSSDRFREHGVCDYKQQGVTVTSFDGSSYLCNTLNQVIRTNLTDPQIRTGAVWSYVHSAAGDKVGTVAFTMQSKESRPGFEGGKMRAAHSAGTELVNVTTIDSYAAQRGLKVDVLKIDAEGADGQVIKGALGQIYSSVGLVTFEGYGKGSLTETMIGEFDTHGFSCYSTSLAGLFKWNGGCWRGSKRRATKGNIFCASRFVSSPLPLPLRASLSPFFSRALVPSPLLSSLSSLSSSSSRRERAPLLTLAYDALSFPAMIDAEAARAAQAGPASAFNASSLEVVDLSRAFIKVKPLCAPYPACLKDEIAAAV